MGKYGFSLISNQLKLWLTLGMAWMGSMALAKDFKTISHTFPIAEEDLYQVMQMKLKKLKFEDFSHYKETMNVWAKQSIQSPKGTDLPRTNKERTFNFDPSFTLKKTLINPIGQVIALKGTKVSPLKFHTITTTLCFLNGEDETQLMWAKEHAKDTHWIFVKGQPLQKGSVYKRAIYFDQGSFLIKKLGILQVPAMVYQKGEVLEIKELIPTIGNYSFATTKVHSNAY